MLFKLVKAVGLLFLGCCLLAVVALSVLFFKPSVFLLAVNKWTDYEVVTQDLQLSVTPLDLQAQGLQVTTNNQILLEIEQASLSFDWRGYMSGRHTLWRGDFSNGTIDLRALPESNAVQNSEPSQSGSLSVQLHAILTALNGQIENLHIILSDQSSLMISNLATQLDGNEQQGYQALKQNISLALKLDEDNRSLSLDGLFSSSRDSNVTNLVLDLQAIDLTDFLSNSDQPASGIPAVTDLEAGEDTSYAITKETVIDWSWLEVLEGINVNLSSPRMVMNTDTLEDVSMLVAFDDSINLQQVNAKVDWGLSEEFRFVDSLVLSGTLRPIASETSEVDADVDISITSPKFELQTKGQLNLNAITGQQLSLNLSMNTFPIKEQDGDLFSSLLQQYLPIKLSSNAATATDKFRLVIEKSSFGESTFDSILNIENISQEMPKLDISLNAEKLSFQSPVGQKESEKVSDAIAEKPNQTNNKIFSESPIDFSFMQTADVKADLAIKEFSLNKVTVNDIVGSGSLNSGSEESNSEQRVLAIQELSATIAEGEITGDFLLAKSEQPADIDLRIDVSGLALESLSFMPQEQLSGGDLTIDADLQLVGDSLAEFAAASNGQFYLDVTDAVVQNDRFELIGSDLILDLLNKLNPFSKSDPTTELECATIYLPIDNGVAKIDDSLALQTSKLVILADGDVDLNTEKLDLKFTPISKAGIGVNVSSMVKFIKLGGTLAHPTPEVDAGGLVTSGLAAGAAISTGGVSLLATGLIDKVVKNNACEEVRESYSER